MNDRFVSVSRGIVRYLHVLRLLPLFLSASLDQNNRPQQLLAPASSFLCYSLTCPLHNLIVGFSKAQHPHHLVILSPPTFCAIVLLNIQPGT